MTKKNISLLVFGLASGLVFSQKNWRYFAASSFEVPTVVFKNYGSGVDQNTGKGLSLALGVAGDLPKNLQLSFGFEALRIFWLKREDKFQFGSEFDGTGYRRDPELDEMERKTNLQMHIWLAMRKNFSQKSWKPFVEIGLTGGGNQFKFETRIGSPNWKEVKKEIYIVPAVRSAIGLFKSLKTGGNLEFAIRGRYFPLSFGNENGGLKNRFYSLGAVLGWQFETRKTQKTN